MTVDGEFERGGWCGCYIMSNISSKTEIAIPKNVLLNIDQKKPTTAPI